ncbi:MAG: SDR family oxidoreductase [Bacteriovoracaceae bacterium]|nr:SDR family oxidoreductase [Bacteroidota bacterium]
MLKHTALITGASGGIGYELAALFARGGNNLVLVARNADKLKEVADEFHGTYGVTVHIVPMNLAQSDAPNELFHYLDRNKIQIDYLINNAGFGTHGKFSEIEVQEQLDLLQLNITTLTHLSRLFIPGMLSRKSGGILNIASTAAFQPGPMMATYYASKSYVLFLSEALASELKGTGVWVTVLCPGPTATGFQSRAGIERTSLGKKSSLMMDVKTVARIGYKGFMKKKTIVVPGVVNRVFAQGVRFSPRKLTREIVKFLHDGE